MNSRQAAMDAITKGNGVLHLAPTWVPRNFARPGKRLRLHPDDYYSLGLHRGGICERWLSSAVHADNGPDTAEDEGLSYVVTCKEKKECKITLLEAVEELKEELIGEDLYQKFQTLPMFAKLFDNLGSLPHHIHLSQKYASMVGRTAKPELYFFPSQLNSHGGEFPYTFFGLNPGTRREEILECFQNFGKGDNKITEYSRAYRLPLDRGFDVPTGILHAPGSLCTYEPQLSSDVLVMCQSLLPGEHLVSEDLLWKDIPAEHQGDYKFLVETIDWEKNTDPEFYRNHFLEPVQLPSESAAVIENLSTRSPVLGAWRVTVPPEETAVLKTPFSYGLILLQGVGSINGQPMETPTVMRFGEISLDEYFVSKAAAEEGVVIKNHLKSQNLVYLMHYYKV